jgi:hypothetical protein
MPDWLVSHLQKGGQIRAEGVIPVVAQLLEQSTTTKYAYLCHPCVQHVSKLKREGLCSLRCSRHFLVSEVSKADVDKQAVSVAIAIYK